MTPEQEKQINDFRKHMDDIATVVRLLEELAPGDLDAIVNTELRRIEQESNCDLDQIAEYGIGVARAARRADSARGGCKDIQ